MTIFVKACRAYITLGIVELLFVGHFAGLIDDVYCVFIESTLNDELPEINLHDLHSILFILLTQVCAWRDSMPMGIFDNSEHGVCLQDCGTDNK